jgi:hypothetical protein
MHPVGVTLDAAGTSECDKQPAMRCRSGGNLRRVRRPMVPGLPAPGPDSPRVGRRDAPAATTSYRQRSSHPGDLPARRGRLSLDQLCDCDLTERVGGTASREIDPGVTPIPQSADHGAGRGLADRCPPVRTVRLGTRRVSRWPPGISYLHVSVSARRELRLSAGEDGKWQPAEAGPTCDSVHSNAARRP